MCASSSSSVYVLVVVYNQQFHIQSTYRQSEHIPTNKYDDAHTDRYRMIGSHPQRVLDIMSNMYARITITAVVNYFIYIHIHSIQIKIVLLHIYINTPIEKNINIHRHMQSFAWTDTV